MQKVFHNIKPLLLLLLLNALGMLLVISNGELAAERIGILCGVVCIISLVTYVVITVRDLGDSYLFIIISMLCSLGIIMQTRINPDNGIRQMVLYLAGVICFFGTLFMYRKFHKRLNRYTLIYWGVSIALFVITALIGTVHNGSKNWIMIGSLSIQPSEFIRILFVLAMAAIFTNARKSSSRVIKTSIAKQEAKKLKHTRLAVAVLMAFSNAMCLFMQ